MSCQDDAALTGPVSLFVGIEPETENWSLQQHLDVAKFALAHKVSTLFLKVAEAGSRAGDIWYGGIDGVKHTIDAIKATGINVIPYQFLYGGDNLSKDIAIAVQLLQTFGVLCLDIEGSPWVGDVAGGWGAQLASALQAVPGKVWLSHPANFADAGQTPFMRALAPAVNVYMPMAYSDHLVSVYKDQLLSLNPNACIQPTLDMSQEFGANNVFNNAKICKDNGSLAISLWYEGFAQKTPGMLDLIVMLYNVPIGGNTVSLITNSKGENCDIALISQFEPKETEMACGFFTAAEAKYAGLPGKGPTGTPEDVDTWADTEYSKEYGSFDNTQGGGVSEDDMYRLFKTAGNLHYQKIFAISPTSQQASDIAAIRRALDVGYIVAVTVDEGTVWDVDLGGNPYSWNPKPGEMTHVFLLTGVGKPGQYYLAEDWANVVGPLQGNNTVRQGPRKYDENKIGIHWAAILQLVGPDPAHPWLAPIPNGDPLSWPANFNAQVFAQAPPQPPTPDYVRQDFEAEWRTYIPDADVNTGFAKDAYANFKSLKFSGPALTKELDRTDWGGKHKKVQYCVGGKYELPDGGKITFYPYRNS